MPGAKLPRDLVGKVHKYTCQLQPCTKRKQGYRELVLHLATQHQKLKEVMVPELPVQYWKQPSMWLWQRSGACNAGSAHRRRQ